MPDPAVERTAYDLIARLYDVDMAANMPFDDVAFYAALAARAAGPVLELGCGNGRILLALLERGIDAYGVDRSAPMLAELRRKALSRALDGRVAQMDARSLGFVDRFALVICPYSLITYMTSQEDVARMLDGARRAMSEAGSIVVDAFVPQPGIESDSFRVDYRRPHGDATLTRAKRITSLGPRLNRIERRYELTASDGSILEHIETSEDIRLFAPADLSQTLVDAGFSIDAAWWDYRSAERPARPRFFTVSARRRAST